ncbi:MAG: hypothetical protein RLZZ451_2774, partial [Pseudomonadota bacterium]
MSPDRAPTHATPADARRAASLILLRD